MRIAIINEISASEKNSAVVRALEGRDYTLWNVGMTDPDDQPQLTYLHTGFLTGLLLNLGAVDLVVGGCGTGVGYMLSSMMYPGVYCGLASEPLDAWLFAQINGGNCISLALNQGYGWGGDVKLRHLFDRLFEVEWGCGYPSHRQEAQRRLRQELESISRSAHRPMMDILSALDPVFVAHSLKARYIRGFIEATAEQNHPENRELVNALLPLLDS